MGDFLSDDLLLDSIKNFIVMSKYHEFALIVQQGVSEFENAFDLCKASQAVCID